MDIDALFSQARSDISQNGYAYLTGLSDSFDHLAFCQRFGDLIPQYDGELIWSIKPDPKFDDHYHSLNTKKLSPHTECYEYSGLPPKYLVLWCVTAPTCGGGVTTLYDMRKFMGRLEPAERSIMQREFKFSSSSGIQSSNLGRIAYHPFIDEKNGEDMYRFSNNCVDYGANQQAREIGARLVREFEEHCDKITWSKSSLLIWDNRRTLHSREAFSDRQRELRRVWLSDSPGVSL